MKKKKQKKKQMEQGIEEDDTDLYMKIPKEGPICGFFKKVNVFPNNSLFPNKNNN